MDSNNQIKIGAGLSYTSIIINVLTGLLFTPWMIKSIGKEDYGLYTLAMSVITLFVFDFGLGTSVNRFIAKYLAEGRQDKADNCLGLVYRLYLIIDCVMMVVLVAVYFFIPTIYQELTFEEVEKFKIIYIISSFYSILSFPFIPVNGVLNAHERFIQLKGCEIIHKLIVVISMTICLILNGGLYALVCVNAFSGILMIALKLFFIKKTTTQSINWNYKDKSEFQDIVGFSGWITIMSLCQRCIFSLGPTILGAFASSSAIAIFGIANTIEGYVFTFSSALSGMFLPKVSRIIAKGDNILPLMIKVGRIQLMLVSLVVLGFISIGKDFIQLWLGSEFSEAYICIVLIIIPSLFQLPQEIGDQALYANNKIKHRAIAFIVMAIINICLGIPMSKLYGAVGLCVSIGIAYLIRTFILDVIFKTSLHIDLKCFFKKTFLNFIPIYLAAIMITFAFSFWNSISWETFIIKCGIFIFLYFALMFVIMNKEEKNLIKELINEFKIV